MLHPTYRHLHGVLSQPYYNYFVGRFCWHFLYGRTRYLLDDVCCQCLCFDVLQVPRFHLLIICRVSRTLITSLGSSHSLILFVSTNNILD
jgi:hypothetical protein